MLDAVILSDLHLGSTNSQARQICDFLDRIVEGDLETERLILNGDVFDSFDFRRLNKNHWRVLSLLRKLSDHVEIIWLAGNHDGSAEIISHLLGLIVLDDYVLESSGRRMLILHGHIFDEFIDNHPVLTWIGDCVYRVLQWLDRTHRFAKLAKHGSKTFLRCARKIEEGGRRPGPPPRLHGRLVRPYACCRRTHGTAHPLLQQRLLDGIALHLPHRFRRRRLFERLHSGRSRSACPQRSRRRQSGTGRLPFESLIGSPLRA